MCPTTLTGTVVTGTLPQFGVPLPIPNVTVYIPSAPLDAIGDGVWCGCTKVSGSPVAVTTTAVDGTFTLSNIPQTSIGTNVPLVIQLGRWRREITVPSVSACTSTAAGAIRMPRTHLEGDIPLTAIATGSVDAMECTLLKMGIDQAEFTTPAGGGRVHVYLGNNGGVTGGAAHGANVGTTTPGDAQLWGTGGTFANYDLALAPCLAAPVPLPAAELANLVSYTGAGGRFVTSHDGYEWLFNNPPFNTTANWDVNRGSFSSVPASVNTTFPGGTQLENWLFGVGASTTLGDITLQTPRHDVDSVNPPSEAWLNATDPSLKSPMVPQFSFNTPVGSANHCGTVLYLDFHVTNGTFQNATFPSECNPGPMSAQEELFAYSLFSLECSQAPPVPAPTPTP
jgi:hypothetical protein